MVLFGVAAMLMTCSTMCLQFLKGKIENSRKDNIPKDSKTLVSN